MPPQIRHAIHLINFVFIIHFYLSFCTQTVRKINALCRHRTAHHSMSTRISAKLKIEITLKSRNATRKKQDLLCNENRAEFPAWKLFS